MKSANSLLLCRFLINSNKELIEKTALKDCHVIGLNSFILNEKPRIRLYTADPNCELYTNISTINPLLPIHRHKYRDLFYSLHGIVIHYIYDEENWIGIGQSPFAINKYRYNRIGDSNKKIELVEDSASLAYRSTLYNPDYLDAETLHTVILHPDNEKCSWMIIETEKDSFFENGQYAYHQDLKDRPELYKPFTNPIEYLNEYFK